jgi:RNA polymerase-binding transcription factor DksA
MKVSASIASADHTRAAATVMSDETQDGARRPDLTRWRAALEARWRHKLDEAIVLARAYAEIATEAGDDLTGLSAPPYKRLRSRTERAYEVLADIEDALARVDAGTYGICEGCGRPMAEDWLTDQPEIRLCGSCASRRPPPRPIGSVSSARRTSPGRLVPAARAPAGRMNEETHGGFRRAAATPRPLAGPLAARFHLVRGGHD